jgi:methylated-DNA-[protein]-cysteine S-methyltransferase
MPLRRMTSENGQRRSLGRSIFDVIMNAPTFVLDRLQTPLGVMLLVTDDRERLRALDWEDHEARMRRLLRLHYGPSGCTLVAGSSPVRASLGGYFAGDLRAIEGVRVETGGTPFQREVWAALRSIPAGDTLSYGALAVRIGRRAAVRAVGRANGANPVGIVVPCHRVIGADTSLTGYGGGLERKRWLLRHEGARLGAS